MNYSIVFSQIHRSCRTCLLIRLEQKKVYLLRAKIMVYLLLEPFQISSLGCIKNIENRVCESRVFSILLKLHKHLEAIVVPVVIR